MNDILQIIDKHAKSAQDFLTKTVEKKAEAAPTPAATLPWKYFSRGDMPR